jgi:polygalacturonase
MQAATPAALACPHVTPVRSARALGHFGRSAVAFATAILFSSAAAAATYNVKNYGAKGDGSNNDTTAINNAISAANSAGGGIVEFPSGTYSSGSIHLKSNVTLQIDSGATIKGRSGSIDTAESNPNSSYQDYGHSHFHDALIWGDGVTNIGITGPGTIDGNGALKTSQPSSGYGDKALCLKLCDGVVLSDFTIKNGGWFGILTNGTNHMVVTNIKVLDSNQRDAFDLINAKHVDISGSDIEGSDDSMCLKADYALGAKITNQDIHVDNCKILSTGNNAVQFGSETVGDFYDVTFSHLTITSAGKAGLGVTSNDGAIIDGVTFSDVTMTGCVTPIWMKITNNGRAPGSPPPGRIRNITFRNITSTNQPSGAITSTFEGCGTVSPAIPIENVVVDNVKLTVPGGGTSSEASNVPPTDDHWQPRYLGTAPSYGWFLRHVKNITFINCQTHFSSNDDRSAVKLDNNGTNVKIDTLTAQRGSSSPYDIGFYNTSGYQVTNSTNTSGGALRVTTSGSTAATITMPVTYSPVGGSYTGTQTVSLSSATSGASIRYTTDDSTPTSTTGTLYTGPISVASDTAIRAVAFVSGQTTSADATSFYQISNGTPPPPQVAAPVFTPGGGTYSSTQSVSISTTTSGATIRYTTDGSAPTETNGTLYSGPVVISSTTTLKALAYESGFSDSSVTSATYTISTGGGTTAWEAESLSYVTSGAAASVDTDASASGGARVTLNSTSTGAWIEFTLPNVPAGTYSLQLAYKTNNNRGQCTFLVDGAAVGGTLDQYASSASYPVATVGTVTFATTGNHTFRMTVTGKNASSTSYTLSADKITLSTSAPSLAFEAEALTVTNSGVGTTLQTDANASGGQWISLNATSTGSWMEFTLPNVPAGTYSVQLAYKTNNNRGQSTFKIDGTSLGGTIDQYASSSTYPNTTIGTVTFSSTGNHAFRMTVSGKNASSSSYVLSADKITLIGQ